MRLVFISSVIATSALRTISAVIGSTARAPSAPSRCQRERRGDAGPPGRGFKWGRCPVVCTVMVCSGHALTVRPKLLNGLLDEREVQHILHVDALVLKAVRQEPVLRLGDRLHVRNGIAA